MPCDAPTRRLAGTLGAALLAGATVCGCTPQAPSAAAGGPARAAAADRGPPSERGGEHDLRAAREVSGQGDELMALYHLQWVTGDLERAAEGLRTLLEDPEAALQVRGEAALRLAQIEELAGDRNMAVRYLTRCEVIVGADHPLAARAEEAHRRIRSAVPLADVPGPVPGSVVLAQEPPAAAKAFKTAEKRLVAFYRAVVAPRLDNVDAVLRAKRRALQAALKAFGRVIEIGGPLARAAAHFRMGAMCHHFAEALAFDQPAGLLPEVAARLARAMRSESAAFLRRALGHYHEVLKVPGVAGIASWRRLAQREATTLGRVLSRSRQKR